MAKGSKRKSGEKLKALMRAQKINEFLSKSITESEALQNSGDDRPTYESHITDLLENEGKIERSAPGEKRSKIKRRAKASGRKHSRKR